MFSSPSGQEIQTKKKKKKKDYLKLQVYSNIRVTNGLMRRLSYL